MSTEQTMSQLPGVDITPKDYTIYPSDGILDSLIMVAHKDNPKTVLCVTLEQIRVPMFLGKGKQIERWEGQCYAIGPNKEVK